MDQKHEFNTVLHITPGCDSNISWPPKKQRFNCLTVSGGRVVGAVFLQEGEVTMEWNDTTPGQKHDTLLRRQLPGPLIQTIGSYQNYGNTIVSQASIQFQGLETLTHSSPIEVYYVDFQLPNESAYNPQGRVDHIQQTSQGHTSLQLSCQSMTQEKMTVCKTNKTRAEEGSYNKWNRIIKPYAGKKVLTQKAPRTTPEPVPGRTKTAPIQPAYTVRKSRISRSIHLRPYRDRIIHLLALKDYKKSELLFRLQKDGIHKKDKNSLGKILQQVATMNPKTFSYTLKDYVFQELQRDWPGYNELDRQTLELVLARKLEHVQSATATNHLESSRGPSTDGTSPQKDLFNSAFIDPLRKKVRISHLATRQQSTSKVQFNTSKKSAAGLLQPTLPSPATANCTSSHPSLTHLPISNPPQSLSPSCDSCSTPEGPRTPDTYYDSFCQKGNIFEHQQSKHASMKMLASISIQMKYPKILEKKHPTSMEKFEYSFTEDKANNQKCNTEMMQTKTTGPRRQNKGANSVSTKGIRKVCTASEESCSTSGPSDYLTDYFTIVSSEQRHHYAQDFRAEYDEYQALRAKMLTLSSTFITLGTKRKQLSPGTKKYQGVGKEITLEYQRMKQKNPNFYAEKDRCWYLYNKLAHIKRLVHDFDQKQMESW